jgi:hypothetical protein
MTSPGVLAAGLRAHAQALTGLDDDNIAKLVTAKRRVPAIRSR